MEFIDTSLLTTIGLQAGKKYKDGEVLHVGSIRLRKDTTKAVAQVFNVPTAVNALDLAELGNPDAALAYLFAASPQLLEAVEFSLKFFEAIEPHVKDHSIKLHIERCRTAYGMATRGLRLIKAAQAKREKAA